MVGEKTDSVNTEFVSKSEWLPLYETANSDWLDRRPEKVNGYHSAPVVAPQLLSPAEKVTIRARDEVELIDPIAAARPRPDLVGTWHPKSGWYDQEGYASTIDPVFRRDFLPGGWLGEYVTWAGRTTHCPPMFHVIIGLAYASFELARRGWYFEGVSDEPAPALWFALLSRSGAGKSISINRLKMMDGLVEQQLPESLRDPKVEGDSFFTVKGSGPGVLTALESRMYQTPRGEYRTAALLVNDEMKNLFTAMAKGDAQFLADVVELADQSVKGVQIHQRAIQKGEDGGRKGRLARTAISTFFATSPGMILGSINESIITGGFAGRVMWIPSPTEWPVFWGTIPPVSMMAAAGVAQRISSWVQRIANRGMSAEVHLEYGSAAWRMHEEWSGHLRKQYPNEGVEQTLFCPRLSNATAKLAATIAVIEQNGGIPGQPLVVQPEHYVLARNIAIEAYKGAFVMLEIAKPREVQRENTLVKLVNQKGRKGLSLTQACEVLARDVQSVRRALQALEDLGIFVTATLKLAKKSGRPGIHIWATEHAPPARNFIMDGNKKLLCDAEYKAHIAVRDQS